MLTTTESRGAPPSVPWRSSARRVRLAQVTCEIPRATSVLAALDSVLQTGWCLFPCDPSVPWQQLAPAAARLREVRRGVGPLSTLTPRHPRRDGERSLSAIYRLGSFPLHTDCAHHVVPPRFGSMRLVSQGSDRNTRLADGTPLLERQSELCRAVCVVSGGATSFLSRPLFSVASQIGIRWDNGCMRSADPRFNTSVESVGRAIDMLMTTEVRWQLGWALMWDNWRMLHGRSEQIHGSQNTPRILQRVLFDLGRP